MTNSTIQESTASGEEISAIVAQLESSLVNVPRGHGIIALLSIVLIMMYPDIKPAALQSGIKDVSRYICCMLEGVDEGERVVLN